MVGAMCMVQYIERIGSWRLLEIRYFFLHVKPFHVEWLFYTEVGHSCVRDGPMTIHREHYISCEMGIRIR